MTGSVSIGVFLGLVFAHLLDDLFISTLAGLMVIEIFILDVGSLFCICGSEL